MRVFFGNDPVEIAWERIEEFKKERNRRTLRQVSHEIWEEKPANREGVPKRAVTPAELNIRSFACFSAN